MFKSIEPAFAPEHRPSFLLDWEVTLRCNLDCSYCNEWGHNNKTAHPELERCKKTIDFMFEYVDLYMQHKAKWTKSVVLNIYGGESLFHPDIEEIYKLLTLKYKENYADKWPLTVNTTTNLVAGKNLLGKLLPYIDNWVVSYHTEANEKQKKQVKDNLLFLKLKDANIKVTVLMNPSKFEDAITMIDFCEENKISYLPRQLDQLEGSERFNYNKDQINWFNNFYKSKTYKAEALHIEENDNTDLSQEGRACCGGRQFCSNKNYKQREFFISNRFTNWSCSVNWFFLYIKQQTGNIYNNKDCRMRFDNTEGPIGTIDQADKLIADLKHWLETNSMPVIKCAKSSCWCGMCAPKAENIETFHEIIPKYLVGNPFTTT